MVSLSTIVNIVMLLQTVPEPACSLTIHLVDSHGRPVHDYVTIVEAGGRQIEKKHYPGGVRFCDLGIMPVRIEVRPLSISCTWRFSEVVDVNWGEERAHTIVVPSEPCKYPVPNLSTKCALLFRIKDEDGKWLGESRIMLLTPSRRPLITDRYGRAFIQVPMRSLVTGEVSVQGHHPSKFNLTCDKPLTEREIEVIWVR